MISSIPIDSDRLTLVAAGTVNPIVKWGPDPANPGRNMEIGQETDDNGVLMWSVDCILKSGRREDRQRSEVVNVRVPAAVQPVLAEFQPVKFAGLRIAPAKDQANRLTGYWDADRILDPDGKLTGTRPAPTKEQYSAAPPVKA